MTKLTWLVLLQGLSCLESPLHAVTIASVTGKSTSEALIIGQVCLTFPPEPCPQEGQQATAVSWSQNQTYQGVSISVFFGGLTGPRSTGGPVTVYLTTQIGPGTKPSAVITRTVLPSTPYGFNTVFSGLTLGPGTFYIVVASSSFSTHQFWDNASPATVFTDTGVSGVASYAAFGLVENDYTGSFSSFPLNLQFEVFGAPQGSVECSTILTDSLFIPNLNGSPTIAAAFQPNLGYTLAQAAALCGFIEFDWQSLITFLPQPAPYFYAAGSTTPAKAPPAFNDPPPSGYAYQNPPNAVGLPVYWNIFTGASDSNSLLAHETPAGANATILSFTDTPSDYCLPGGTFVMRTSGVLNLEAPPSCISGAPAGSKISFTTHVVGIMGDLPGASVVDTGIGFDWTTTYNGTTGGIAVLNTTLPPDPGSGTGGVTVTNVNQVTGYQYPRASLPSPASLLTGNQVSVSASGLAYSRVSQTFDGSVTITNISGSPIAGPFQIVLNSLTAGVGLANLTGVFGGWPYLTVSNLSGLAASQSTIVSVQFKNPSNETITFLPICYSGSFN
jgi:hypothetical protein